MTLEKLEEKLNSHIIFIYNNIALQDSAIIDNQMVTEIEKSIKNLNKYNSITFVLNTRGGNLASGYKIISMLKEKYKELNAIVLERCGSTGTFMLLAADKIYTTPSAMITPTEPQMQIYDGSGESVSTAVIRNYIESNMPSEKIKKLDAITYGNYLSTILYFKNLCYNIFTEDKAERIINFMLREVNSHQQPLIKKDFKKMGIELLPIPEHIIDCLETEHQKIKDFLDDKTNGHIRHTIIRNSQGTTSYEKRYNQDKHKVAEGYFIIEEEKFMKKQNKQNARVADIIKEVDIEKQMPVDYQDATAAHWDSYNDSHYHDNYDDRYDDYGDNSIYHDCYKDSVLVDTPKAKVKSRFEVKQQ